MERPVLDFLVQSPPLRCWDYIRAPRGRAGGRELLPATDFPCGPVPGYAVSHSVLLLLEATRRTPPSSPLLLILTFPELSRGSHASTSLAKPHCTCP